MNASRLANQSTIRYQSRTHAGRKDEFSSSGPFTDDYGAGNSRSRLCSPPHTRNQAHLWSGELPASPDKHAEASELFHALCKATADSSARSVHLPQVLGMLASGFTDDEVVSALAGAGIAGPKHLLDSAKFSLKLFRTREMQAFTTGEIQIDIPRLKRFILDESASLSSRNRALGYLLEHAQRTPARRSEQVSSLIKSHDARVFRHFRSGSVIDPYTLYRIARSNFDPLHCNAAGRMLVSFAINQSDREFLRFLSRDPLCRSQTRKYAHEALSYLDEERQKAKATYASARSP